MALRTAQFADAAHRVVWSHAAGCCCRFCFRRTGFCMAGPWPHDAHRDCRARLSCCIGNDHHLRCNGHWRKHARGPRGVAPRSEAPRMMRRLLPKSLRRDQRFAFGVATLASMTLAALIVPFVAVLGTDAEPGAIG